MITPVVDYRLCQKARIERTPYFISGEVGDALSIFYLRILVKQKNNSKLKDKKKG